MSWCSTFLSERTIALSFDGRTNQQCPVSTGIPQGSPASPVLFLLYLRPLFDTLNTLHPDIWSPSYIDDVALVTQGKTREGNARALEAAARTAFEWARNNAVAFDDAKSEMLHFHRTRKDIITEDIKIRLPNGTIVAPGTRGGKQDVVRWIGVLFNRKLSFTYHVHTKMTAASRAFNALCSLVRYETGLSPSATRQLYQACVISRSDFGAEIWWNKQRNLEQLLQLQQNNAHRPILNAFKSTPTLALHNEAALPPVSVRLDNKQRKYTLRLFSLPTSHPVVQHCPTSFPIPNHLISTLNNQNEYDWAWQNTNRPLSRLVRILQHVGQWLHPNDVVEDTAHPTTSPWIPSPIITNIATLTKTDASAAHLELLRCLQRNSRNIIAYTDGSQLTKNTGAGYSIPTGLPRPVRAIVPMGTTMEVFDAELRAIYECLLTCQKFINRHRLHRCNIHIFTDNQSAIKRASTLARGPGQETAYEIHELALTLKNYDTTITIHWVPGHTDIAGNDDADKLAKQAATQPPTMQLPISLSWL
jgi:ribonuclease HI